MSIKNYIVLCLCLAFVAPLAAQQPVADGEVAIPRLTKRVTDLTATLSAGEVQALEQKLAAFEQQKGSQIAVLILPTTRPETIEGFSIRVAEQWKIGRAKVDDGVILIVAKNDRKMRIEVGYGLEGAIPDAYAKRIVDDHIAPRFKQKDFAGGINEGVDRIIGLIQGEDLPEPEVSSNFGRGDAKIPYGAIFIGVIFFGFALRAVLGRIVGAGIAALIGFAAGWFFISFGVGAILGAVAFFWLAFGGSGGGISSGGYSSGGSFGGGSFGGGGFSGGGGGFGGGGASGSW